MTKYTYIAGFLTASMALAACSSYEAEFLNVPAQQVTAQLSLSVSGKTGTRMTDAATQSDQAFRGMTDIVLIPFALPRSADETIKATDSRVADNQALADFTSFEFSSNSNLFDITIPVGTNAFLIYGRSSATPTGELTPEGLTSAQPGGISFSPVQIVNSVETGKAAGSKGDAIITYLNSIFNKNWADAANYPVLNGLYEMVQKMKAGSSASVEAFVREVYEVLKKSPAAAGVSDALKAILAQENLPETLPEPADVKLPTDCQGYPADLGLPEGTAAVIWDESDTDNMKFVAVTDKNNLGAMNVDVTKFVKPAELWYRTNSRINTDSVSRQADYTTQETWAGVLGTYAKEKWYVEPETQSIAVREQLQYAVGRLDMKLTAAADILKDMEDNEISINDLSVTGVLVGQQCPVDFLFKSKGGDAFTAYDSEISTTINKADPTHTLVLETKKDEPVNIAVELQNNSDVAIVTGEDDQIVPPGCKFYLVGQLSVDGHTNYDANTDAKNRVFCQDYVTEVTFSVNDLKNAYYVIPPLSAAELQLSLGVTKWRMVTPAGIELK